MTSFKKTLIIILFTLLSFITVITVKADMFPKPTLQIKVYYEKERELAVDLLIKRTLNNREPRESDFIDIDFYNYLKERDFNNYYSASLYQGAPYGIVVEEKEGYYLINLTYLYPKKAKLLILDKDNNSVFISDDFSQKAFDALMEITLPSDYLNNEYNDITIVKENLKLVEANNWRLGIQNLILRIALTFILEVVILIFFLYRQKRSYLLVGLTNLITQSLLSLALFIIVYIKGDFSYLFYFITLELAVIILESFFYSKTLKEHSKKRAIIYAIVANIVSIVIGFLLPFSFK